MLENIGFRLLLSTQSVLLAGAIWAWWRVSGDASRPRVSVAAILTVVTFGVALLIIAYAIVSTAQPAAEVQLRSHGS